ncbi:hypothetical protein EJ07DRAFT_158875 [Lizonia empirigonia]|nr:hypothetical protein EJ07DRAFT_158875 [Lizonia empirigonia]
MRLPTLLVILNGMVPRTLAQIDLGTAAPFGVTIINGELGLFPNTESSITGFPPGQSGDVHAADGVADTVTVINGTPCTTLSYYEQTCSCTKTTVVLVAYTTAPTAVDVTLVSGLPCTATQYYEEDCDCIRSSMAPIPVVTASADIATVINNIPCITSKYYEPACNCIQTSTIPVRIGSAGETAVTATAIACTQTVNNMISCIST